MNTRGIPSGRTALLGMIAALSLGATSAHAVIDDTKALALMKASGCSVCHSVDKKIVGPAYKDVALKRKGDSGALATMEKAVRNGSKDVYGPMPMTPTPPAKISDEDLRELLQWVLTR